MANTVQDFWDRVEVTDGCWLWRGAMSGPYGAFGWRMNSYRAHRMPFLFEGIDIEGKIVHHTCGTKICVRPDHLQVIASKAEHVQLHAGDVCSRGHPRTPENTSVRIRVKSGYPQRECRVCNRIRKGGTGEKRKPWTQADCARALWAWTQEHGHQPSVREWRGQLPSLQVMQSLFGSWSAALGAAGLTYVAQGKRPPR